MVSNTKEVALEQAIQRHLTGLTSEELAGQPAPEGHGPFRLGLPADFDAKYALDTRLFWEFLETTQGKELAKLKARNPGDWQRKILERFDRLIKKNGVLHLLKKGLAVDDVFFALMYPAPLASSAAKVLENFAANIFSVTRQVRYSQTNPGEEIDMVLFINGLLKEALHGTLDGVPFHIDLDELGRKLAGVQGVKEIHDLHVWPIASEKMALSAHVRIANLLDWPGILLGLTEIAEHEGIQHVTFQAELHSDDPQAIRFSARAPVSRQG